MTILTAKNFRCIAKRRTHTENFVDMEEYPFVEGRGIHSLLCVPLITKAKKFGLVLIEHKYFNALMTTI